MSASCPVVDIGADRRDSTSFRAIFPAAGSSPNSRISRAKSRSGVEAMRSAAVTGEVGSSRMSRGPSRWNENPRSAVSTWLEEKPRSAKTISAANPCSDKRLGASAKFPWRVTTFMAGAAAPTAAEARSRFPGSESFRMIVPEPITPAMAAACPPSPAVQSRNVSPGCGASNSSTSLRRTGMCPGELPGAGRL